MTPRGDILVVEDDASIRAFISEALADEGFAVREAADGATALDLLAQAPAALILLDVRMPYMDGAAFAEAYRAQPGPHAPIVVITASLAEQQHAEALGAVAAVAKPFQLDALVDLVHQIAGPPSGTAPTA